MENIKFHRQNNEKNDKILLYSEKKEAYFSFEFVFHIKRLISDTFTL